MISVGTSALNFNAIITFCFHKSTNYQSVTKKYKFHHVTYQSVPPFSICFHLQSSNFSCFLIVYNCIFSPISVLSSLRQWHSFTHSAISVLMQLGARQVWRPGQVIAFALLKPWVSLNWPSFIHFLSLFLLVSSAFDGSKPTFPCP